MELGKSSILHSFSHNTFHGAHGEAKLRIFRRDVKEIPHIPRPAAATKKKEPGLSTRLLEGGDDLLSRFRSTIGAMKLNFSVRDGKRWILHAIITLMS